jgi:voltage-gated potassium channel
VVDVVSIPKLNEEGIAGNILLWLVAATVFFAVVSLYSIFYISHDAYLAGYYTMSTLLDSSGVNLNQLTNLTTQANATRAAFDSNVVIGISILDGITKIAIIGFVIAAFIDFITKVDIRARMMLFRRKRLAKNHIIICGYSTLAEKLCAEFASKGVNFLLVERDPLKTDTLIDVGYPVVNGDFTDAETLTEASIRNARAVVFASKDDFANLLGVITARYLNHDVSIIARSRDEANVSKMHKAGAGLCVIPEALAGLDIGSSILSRMGAKK